MLWQRIIDSGTTSCCNGRLLKSKHAASDNLEFVVVHYAENVCYSAHSLVVKNKVHDMYDIHVLTYMTCM